MSIKSAFLSAIYATIESAYKRSHESAIFGTIGTTKLTTHFISFKYPNKYAFIAANISSNCSANNATE